MRPATAGGDSTYSADTGPGASPAAAGAAAGAVAEVPDSGGDPTESEVSDPHPAAVGANAMTAARAAKAGERRHRAITETRTAAPSALLEECSRP
ncbi:MAG: hypothetical protein OXG47_07555 [bacterium]|nr:hypothetical protein [bacterium]